MLYGCGFDWLAAWAAKFIGLAFSKKYARNHCAIPDATTGAGGGGRIASQGIAIKELECGGRVGLATKAAITTGLLRRNTRTPARFRKCGRGRSWVIFLDIISI